MSGLIRIWMTCAWVVMFIVASARDSFAQSYRYDSVLASATTDVMIWLDAGINVIETRNASPGTDPVARLWAFAFFPVEVARDDDGGVGLNARLTIDVTTPGTYRLIVHAKSGPSSGVADVYVNDGLLAAASPIGGTTVRVPTDSTRPLRYESALLPGGAPDTMLYGLNCKDALGQLVAFDDNGGVGVASRFERVDICQVVVASAPRTMPGVAALYTNDFWRDPDLDGLGNTLEYALGTCPSRPCPGAFNPTDSDRDGLSDSAELFGIDDVSNPQYLPRWGATPVHKDIFVEVDYWGLPTNPVGPYQAMEIQRNFDPAPALDIGNRDGTDGIRVHLDIGASPLNAFEAAVFGDWGGSGPSSMDDYRVAPSVDMQPIRRGVFRYAHAEPGRGGQAASFQFGWGVDAGSTQAFTHELGHLAGLEHWGHSRWGTANCKPNYVSLMNYLYTYAPDLHFSTGENAAIVLNPAHAPELGWTGPAVRLATGSSTQFWSDPTQPGSIDWNRDDAISGFSVRAPATWAPGTWCGAFSAGAQSLSATDIDGVTSPDIVRLGARLYVFFVHAAGGISYVHSPIIDGESNGPWTKPRRLQRVTDAVSLSVLQFASGVLLAYGSRGGQIYTYAASGVDASGYLTGWGAAAAPRFVAYGRMPELSTLYVNPAVYRETTVTGLFYENAGAYRWSFLRSGAAATAWSSGGGLRNDRGEALLGHSGAAIVPWPMPDAYTAGEVASGAPRTSCGVFPDEKDVLRFHCYDAAADSWNDLSAGQYDLPQTVGKPALAYHVFRRSTGTPVGHPSRGQFWINYQDKSDGVIWTWLSRPLDVSLPPGPTTLRFPSSQRATTQDGWLRFFANDGMSLYEDLALSTLKGVWHYASGVSSPASGLQFLPYADGSFDQDMTDGSDYQVMNRMICARLRGDAYCGGPTTNAWGY